MTELAPIPALWRLIGTAPRGRVLALLAVMIVASLSEGFGIVMLVPLLENLGGGQSGGAALSALQRLPLPPFSLGSALLIIVILTALRAASQYGQSVLSAKLQHNLVDDLRLRCFGGLLQAEWKWLAERRSADHASLLVTNIGRIGVGLNQALSLIASIASLAACLAAAMLLSWQIMAFTVASGAVLLFSIGRHRKHALQLGHNLSAANRALQGQIHEGLAGIRLTKIVQGEGRHRAKMAEVLLSLRGKQLAFVENTARSRAVLQVAGAAMVAATVYAAVVWWHLSYAVLLPLIFVFARMVPILAAIQQSYHHWLHAVPALSETHQLLFETDDAKEATPNGRCSPMPLNQSLELVTASFLYASRSQPALNDVSLTINARTTTAISGPSGAGKSSLADMLMGLILPERGTMRVDGVTITPELRQNWRASVAYVQQDAFLFNDSIQNNLLWSNPDASEAELLCALATAAAEFVHDLPQGIETIVGDGGVRLSGGERQRIALARALLRKPALLILDEATSALDTANEMAIRRAIAKLHGDLTIILIGHRLSMIDQADSRIELRDGRVLVAERTGIASPAHEMAA